TACGSTGGAPRCSGTTATTSASCGRRRSTSSYATRSRRRRWRRPGRRVHRLTGLDAGFLYMETPTLHMHTLKIAGLDPSTAPGGYSFEQVKQQLGGRLHLLPPFRRRLVPVPFGIHHPLRAEDPDFDLDRHVRRTVARHPGGTHELAAVISDIASRPLERNRPLWELWVVEGLDGGTVGFVAK